jgi:hypothetical protein
MTINLSTYMRGSGVTPIAVTNGGTGTTTSTGTGNTVLSNGPTLLSPIITGTTTIGSASISETSSDLTITAVDDIFLKTGNGARYALAAFDTGSAVEVNIGGKLLPEVTETHNLGASSQRWNQIFGTSLDITGSGTFSTTTSSAVTASANTGYSLFRGTTNSSGGVFNVTGNATGSGVNILSLNAALNDYEPLVMRASTCSLYAGVGGGHKLVGSITSTGLSITGNAAVGTSTSSTSAMLISSSGSVNNIMLEVVSTTVSAGQTGILYGIKVAAGKNNGGSGVVGIYSTTSNIATNTVGVHGDVIVGNSWGTSKAIKGTVTYNNGQYTNANDVCGVYGEVLNTYGSAGASTSQTAAGWFDNKDTYNTRSFGVVGTTVAGPTVATPIAAFHAGLEVFSVSPLGAVTLGGATQSTSGVGIKFPATQSASSDANTLDDYEEGTWTPSPTNLTVVGTPTYTGTYVKIGRQVTCTLNVKSTTTTASTVGSTYFSGLPFATSGFSVLSAVNHGSVASYGNGSVQSNVAYTPTWPAVAEVDVTFTYFV